MSNRLHIDPSEIKISDPRSIRARIQAAEEKYQRGQQLSRVAKRYGEWKAKLSRIGIAIPTDALQISAFDVSGLEEEAAKISEYEALRSTRVSTIPFIPVRKKTGSKKNVDPVSLYRLVYTSPGFGHRPVAAIVQEIAGLHNIAVQDIKGVRRARHICVARQHCYYAIVTERPDLSYPAIGRYLGGKDHTTVMYGAGIFAERYGLPPVVRAK